MSKMFVDAEVKSLGDAENPNGEFEVILSAPTLDRDNEVIDAKAFEPLPEHITFDIDHGLSTATTVGSGRPYYDGDTLKVRGSFSSIPRAQEVRTLVTEGHIRTTSVAMRGMTKTQKDGVAHITKAELLNGAFVPVPSNREALVLSSKAGARNNAADAGRIQQMHDLTVANGATCEGAKAVAADGRKAVVGSYEDRQEAIREALAEHAAPDIAAMYPNAEPGDYEWRVSVVATFDDHVVYRLGYDGDDAFQVGYSWDGETVTIDAASHQAVTVDQVVTPAAEKTAAPDATGADVADAQQHLTLRAQALSLLTAAT